MNLNLRKFFGIIILSFGSIFLLAACVFTATDYEPAPTPGEPQENGILYFNGNPSFGSHDQRNRLSIQPNINIGSNMVIGLTPTGGSSLTRDHILIAFVPITITNSENILLNNLHLLDNVWPGTTQSQTNSVLRDVVFVGEYNGKSHTKLMNFNNDIAVINNDSGIIDFVKDLFPNYFLYRMILIVTKGVNNPIPNVQIRSMDLISLLGGNHVLVEHAHFNQNNINPAHISIPWRHPLLNELPEELRPETNIPDDGDIVEPEVPGNGDTDNESEVPGTTPEEPNEPEVFRGDWWEQFIAWLRRILFV